MDFRRSNRHFQLSSDPRQPQQPVSEQVEPAVAGSMPVQPQQPQEQAPAEPAVAFVPPPPEVPVAEPPVIESMQSSVEVYKEELPEHATPDQPVAQNAPHTQAQPEPIAQTNQNVSQTMSKPAKTKDRSYVQTRYVILGAAIFVIALIGSVVYQQMTIAQLKEERAMQAEQLKQVNPISVGAGATEPTEDEQAPQENADSSSLPATE